MNVKLLVAGLTAAFAFPPSALSAPSVMIEPVKVELDRNWVYDMKDSRATGGPSETDARRFGADLAASLQAEIDKAIRAQGLEIVSQPAPGVIRLSARIDDLLVNSLEDTSPGVRAFTREAGRATLRAEGRDAAGSVVLQSESRAGTGDKGRVTPTTNVSNRFWFDALFRDWAVEIATELKAKAR